MLNEVIDLREVRAQMADQSTQSLGSSFARRGSEDELEIISLKEVMRQRDKYYSACLVQQQTMLQVS
jgi:hypothetical protein